MTATITEAGPHERLVTFQISDSQIEEAKRGAARRLSQDIKIHGFRPGKAPVKLVEATVGADRVRSEAIEDLLDPMLGEVLAAEEIRPAVNPELESVDDVDGGVDVTVKVTLWPTIDLPNYRDRDIEVSNPAVSDEDVDAQIKRMLAQFATVEEVDRPAGEGDFVSIDISATKDGEPVEDARASDLLYEVGSGLFLEGMDEQVAGASAGDELIFDAPLPEGFGDQAGEVVTFTVVVNEVKERVLPDLDDEWVDENTEFESVDDLVEALREGLADAKLRAVSREFADKALSTLRDQVDVDLPEAIVRTEMDRHLHDFMHRLEENDLTLEDYFNATSMPQDQFIDDLRAQAELSLRNRLIIEAVVETEDITVSEEDLSTALRALAARSDDPVAYIKAFNEAGQGLALASDILRNRALDAILSNANPVDEDGNPVDLSLEIPEVEAEVVSEDAEEGVVVAEVLEEE